MSLLSKLFGDAINLDFDQFKTDVVDAVKDEAKAQFDVYFPKLLELAKAEFHDQFEQWMPILMTGLSKALVTTSVKVADTGVDVLVKMTPSTLDDEFVAPLAKDLIGWLGTLFAPPAPPTP